MTYPPLSSLKKNSQGLPIKGHVNQRWLSSGRTIQNNKNKAIKQYEPFHSSTWRYEAEKEVTDTGISPTMHYDVLGRLIKTDTPKGFMSKVNFSAWEQESYDANDCILESDYYKKNHNSLQSGELDALKKASQHANTPAKSILDNLGRAIENIAVDENGKKYITSVQLDIENKQLSITDARQFELNKNRPSTKQIRNFNYTYDMQGNLLKTDSMDAGIDIAFTDSIGKSLFSWDSRGYNATIDYDELHRPTSKHIKGNSLNQTVERLFYGDSTINSRKYNRIGKLIKHYHQAGIDITESFDFKGKPLSTQQQLRAEYKKEVNWNDLNSEKLLPKIYENKLETNVIGKPIWQELADGSIHYPTFTKSGKLKKVAVSYPENPTKRETIVEDIIYNEKGQRKKIEYANGVLTNYKYDPKTYDLTHLKTKRKSDNKVLQDIAYFYDPAGNITRIEDASHQKVFYDQQQVSPICDYTYDALYQLKEATGREHPALQKNSHKKGFKQSAFIKLNDQQKLRNYTEKYSYDEAGNLTEQKHLANQNNWTRKIEVDQNSNRAVLKDDLNGNSMDSFFDPNGNLIKLDHLRKINWNFRDNIQSVILVERANGKHDAEYYVYDEDGNRVRKIKEIYSNNGATLTIDEKIYLGGIEIKKIRKSSNSVEKIELERISTHLSDDSSRIAISHYWKVDTKNREVDQPKVRKTHYQLNNHLGSASLELSAKGEIISYEEYMPYGGTAFSAGKNQKEVALKDYRYSGKERDDSTGLYYYGQRYYVPWMCRWLNPDPIGQKGGLNLYEFVQSNPINLIDPNGEAPVTVERGMGLDARSYALRKSHWSWMLTKELGYSAWNFFSGGFLQSHDRMLEKRLKGKAYAKRFAVELSKSAVTVASSLVGGNLARGAKTAGAAMIRGGIGGGLTNAATIGYGELIESSVYRRKFNFKSVGKSALIGFVFGAIAGKVNFKLVQLRTKNIDNILSKLDNEFGFGKNFLATTKPGKIGISIGRKLTPTELAALSHKHKVEFGIVQSLDANKKIHYQLHSGSYMKIKYSYTPGHTESKIIVHTHPAMLLNKFSSGIDRKTLRKTPNQISAEIVPLKTGTFKVSLTLNKNTHTYYSRPFGKQLQGLKKVLKKP